jgi:hypothetical protein
LFNTLRKSSEKAAFTPLQPKAIGVRSTATLLPVSAQQRKSRYGLTHDQILAIYQRTHTGENCRTVAEEFGISYGVVYAIMRGRSWAWLTGHKTLSEKNSTKS